VKKPMTLNEEQTPRVIQRADILPTTGFALVVDGRLKTQYEDEAVARKAAGDLKGKFPMLQVQIYDAATKQRSLI
jgi:hypothetical protein